jgi:hypothetical protein
MKLSASDLHKIAEALDPIETNELFTENPVIGRIEVIRPDGDDVVGYFEREGDTGKGEAWFGFTTDGVAL